jgi:UDP-N-acetylmuramoylalanine--D-glutamate ligase
VSRPPLPDGPYLVLGLARSGQAAVAALLARGETVLGADRDWTRALADVELVDGLAALERVRCVIKSPGVPREDAVVVAARSRGIFLMGELELAWRLLDQDFIAVTGTNGKTTTVELLGAIHRAAGLGVAVAGNVGRAASGLVGALAPDDVVVCEASSFQLEDTVAFAPDGGALLNIAPDHLDRHGDMDDYLAAKLRLFAHQGPAAVAVLPADGPKAPGEALRVTFGSTPDADLRDDGTLLRWHGEPLIAGAEIRLRGLHNRANAMAAAALALARGIAAEAVADALATFRGVEHRLEEVATVGGVLYVNDSKATNTASTLVALRAFEPGSVHLILGGRGPGQDFGVLREEVAARARAVYLIGEEATAIAAALSELGAVDCGTLERAVETARAAAAPGEVVLLSPACKSFDQFRDFEARGEAFRTLVRT